MRGPLQTAYEREMVRRALSWLAAGYVFVIVAVVASVLPWAAASLGAASLIVPDGDSLLFRIVRYGLLVLLLPVAIPGGLLAVSLGARVFAHWRL